MNRYGKITCPMCGKEFQANSSRHIFCEDCKYKAYEKQRRKYRAESGVYKKLEKIEPEPEYQFKGNKELEEKNREALKNGMSYGQYKAKEYAKKYARVEV